MEETETMTCWLREDGIVQLVTKQGSKLGLNETKKDSDVLWEVAERRIRPVLADISNMRTASREARMHAKEAHSRQTVALGLITNGPIAQLIGKLFLAFSEPSIPTKIFTDENEAIEWLLKYKTE